MTAEALIGAAVAMFFISNRARWVYVRHRNRKHAERFEQSLRRARDAMTSTTSPYHAVTGADAELVAGVARASVAYEDKLRACGFALLGDLVFKSRDAATAIARVMIDAAGTSCAYIMIMVTEGAGRDNVATSRVHFAISSYATDEMFNTRAIRTPLAEPPSAHRQLVEADLKLDAFVAKHRAFVPLDDPAKTFVSITSIDSLLAELQRVHERTVRWREAQAPDALLEADLRTALGEQYERFGKVWAQRIRSRLPQATIRRPS